MIFENIENCLIDAPRYKNWLTLPSIHPNTLTCTIKRNLRAREGHFRVVPLVVPYTVWEL